MLITTCRFYLNDINQGVQTSAAVVLRNAMSDLKGGMALLYLLSI